MCNSMRNRTSIAWRRRLPRASSFRWSLRIPSAVLAACVVLSAGAAVCLAGPGSGTAEIWPRSDTAGTYGSWTIRYTTAEDFHWWDGGTIEIEIPAGWSTPQISDSTAEGFVRAVSNQPQDLDSIKVNNRTIQVFLGAFFHWFMVGDYVDVTYGASSGYARTQTAARDSVSFVVRSDPAGTSTLPLASGSPTVDVVPGPQTRMAVFFAGSEAGALSFSADQDSNVFEAKGLDVYDNAIKGIECTWSVTNGIGLLTGGKDSTNTFDADRSGSGFITAEDDSGNVDSTGLITVSHGAYVRLDVGEPGTAVAGEDFTVSAAALDADGNIVDTGPGSDAALTLSAWRDSVGSVAGSGNLLVATLNLSSGQASINEKYFVAESIYVRAEDLTQPAISDFGQAATLVGPGAPSILVASPDTLSIVAGTQASFTLTSIDSFGNVSPVSLSQTLELSTGSPGGEFREVGGSSGITQAVMSDDSVHVSFDYYDNVAGEFGVSFTDTDSNAPAFSPVVARVSVFHSAEDTLVVSGISDPVIAGTPSDVAVEARDGFGNRITEYGGTVSFSSTDQNSRTVLPIDYTFVPADSGRHVFPLSVKLTKAGEQSVSAIDVVKPSLSGVQAAITVTPENCDSLLLALSSMAPTAGEWLDLGVEAIDEYENRAVGYTGTVTFASTDTSASAAVPAHYSFTAADSGFAAFPVSTRLTRAGIHAISASDSSEQQIDCVVSGILVSRAPASILWLSPDTLSIEAGGQGTFTLTSTDSFENVSPVGLQQRIYLWTNSATGEFRDSGGSMEIFEKLLPTDSSRVSFDYHDTRPGEFQIAAMDADMNAPAFSPVGAAVSVRHSEGDTLIVTGIRDPFPAGDSSDVVVEVRDGFGNRVMNYSGTIGFSSSDDNPRTVLPANYTFVASDSGRHVFPLAVKLAEAGEQVVGAFDVAESSVDGYQAGVTVAPGICDSLLFSASSMSVIAGERFDLRVEARDEFGNRATGFTDVLGFASSDAGDSTTLPGYYRFVPSDSGAHVFAGAARLTTAGTHTITARDTSRTGIQTVLSGISVAAGLPSGITLFPPGAFNVNSGGSQVLTATARDEFGNPTAGAVLSVIIKDSADGRLEDDPANSNNTSGGVAIQTGATDTLGRVTVLYRAALVSGLSDTIDAYCSTVNHQSVSDIFASSVPAGATVLRMLPATPISDTAGATISISVEAVDSFGNLDASNASSVRIAASSPTARISIDGGSTWSSGAADSLALVNGSTQTRLAARDTKTGAPSVSAEDRVGLLIYASKNNINILPALPAGTITVAALQDTLTANGQTSTIVTAGTLHDAFGNELEPGTEVTVSSALTQIVASDADTSMAGIQILTSADGKVSFAVRSGALAGIDTVGVASTEGTARGERTLVLLAPPNLAYVSGSLGPVVVSAGRKVSFGLELENTGGSRVYLTPSSRFMMSDGNDGIYSSNLSDTVTILPGGRAPLAFDSSVVPAALDPGSYMPVLTVSGVDGAACAFSQSLETGANAVNLVAMEVRGISGKPGVIRGETGVEVRMSVFNPGSVALEVAAVGLTFSSPGHSYSLSSPSLPETLTGGETRVFSFAVDVDNYAPLGPCTMDGFGSGTSGGIGVSDTHADSTATWLVQSSAAPFYVNGSLSRQRVSLGQKHSFSLVVGNGGTASIELDTLNTYLKFGAPGSEYVARLASPTLLSGLGQATLNFAEAQIPPSMSTGDHNAQIFLAGTENEAAFVDTLSCGPDSVKVEAPTVLEYVSISPETVSTGSSPAFSAVIRNSGEATAAILPGTRLAFGSAPLFEATISESVVVEGDSLRTLRFSSAVVDTGFATGKQAAQLFVKMRENGLAEDSVITTGGDSVLVQRRVVLNWVASSLSPARVTAGQIVHFLLQIENQGDADVTLDAGLCALRIRDGANEFLARGEGGSLRVPARQRAALSFAQDTLPGAMAPQSFAVELSLNGTENGFPFEVVIFSPQGELVVQSAPHLRYVHDSLKPDVIAREQTARFSLSVENTGDATLFVADSSFMSLGSLRDTVDCLGGCEIGGHSTAPLVFKSVAIDSEALSAGRHAAILNFAGADWNGLSFSQSVSTSPDSVLVKNPGALRIYATRVSAPNAPHVDTSQAFSAEIEVENSGQEDALNVAVSLSSNGSSVIGAPVVAGLIQGGSTHKFSIPVTAANIAGTEILAAHIDASTGAVSGDPLSIGAALDDSASVLIELPALLSTSVSISEPAGARDDTLSTQQNFKITATITNNGQAAVGMGGSVRITAPQGFVLLSPSVQSFAPGSPIEWNVTAAASVSQSSVFLVTADNVPLAANTGEKADTLGVSKTLSVTVVSRAELSLAAVITEPPDAVDGSLNVGTQFTIVATVSNLGGAKAGAGRLSISLPAGYVLAQGYSQEQDISIGTPARWEIVSPSESTPIQNISALISAVPADENTNADAFVSIGRRDLAVFAEAKHMIAQELPLVEAPAQIAHGQSSISLMALRISNPEEIGQGSKIALRALSLYVTAEDDVRLNNPSSVLSGIKLVRYSSPGTVLGSASVSSANPIRIELSPQADTLSPGESDTLLVMIDVSGSPAGAGVALEIEDGGAFEVVDVASGQQIGVITPDNESFSRVLSAPSRWFNRVHNYPNPFKAGLESTRISYFLDRDSRVTVRIYTLDGKPVLSKTFSDQDPQGRQGLREIIWDGKNGEGDLVLNGVYICKLEASGVSATFKIAVAK